MSEVKYGLGSKEVQDWMREYTFAPRGLGFVEPNAATLDSAKMAAYNVVKSFYQNHPEVFNLAYLSEVTGLKEEDIKARIDRMYHEHSIMFVMNPCVGVYGWGLYYWLVKLKDGCDPLKKERLSNWYQNKDDICTGYETCGDFDFFNGNHMRVLDNLLSDVIAPWASNEIVERVQIVPVRRDLRESSVNMWDSKEGYRAFMFGEEERERLLEVQDVLDADDFKVIEAINNAPSVGDMFDYDVLHELSGLDAKTMKEDLMKIVDEGKYIVPMIHINYAKLGLTKRFYVIKTFQNVYSYRKAMIADELGSHKCFVDVMEFTDAFYDILVSTFAELTPDEKVRALLSEYGEIEEVKVCDSHKQYRRWTCRLDDENDYWEECVFTDDFLEDRCSKEPVMVKLDESEGC